MFRFLPWLVAGLLLSCSPEGSEPLCSQVCTAAVDCLTERAAQEHLVSRLREERPHLIEACSTQCGGTWEPTSRQVACDGQTCDDLLACLPATARAILVDPSPDTLSELPEAQCVAQVAGPEGCQELDSEDARGECLVAAHAAQALRTGADDGCSRLPQPWRQLCIALARRDEASCPAAVPRYSPACQEFCRGQSQGPVANLFHAIATGAPDRCQVVSDPIERQRCQALAARDSTLCPTELILATHWGAGFGESVRRETRVQAVTMVPEVTSAIHRLLGVLAVLLLPWFCYWLVGVARETWTLPGKELAWLALALGLFLVLRLLAAAGPINFVEYERVFVSDPGDFARIGYSGWSLIARPLLRLFGGGYRLFYALNLGAGLVAIVALYRLVLATVEIPRVAGLAALLLAAQPAFARVAASASETLPFVALSLVFLEVLSRWTKATRLLQWGAVLVLLPLLLVLRPEGLMLLALALPQWLFSTHGWWAARRDWSWQSRILALAGVLQFALAALLFLGLPHPPLTLGLWWRNLLSFVPDLVNPRFLSPALTALGIGGALLALRHKGSRPLRLLAGQILMWSLLLLVAWGAQGSEGNLALGASRYVVVWLPWLAAGAALLGERIGSKWAKYGVLLLVLASCLPQLPLLTLSSNLQLEHQFYERALSRLPEGSLLVLPAASPENPEFTPEAAPLAILAMARQEVRWLSLQEALDKGDLPTESYLLQGLYRVEPHLEQLAERFRLQPVVSRTFRSVPDLPTNGRAMGGQEVTVGLYRLER